mgnify:CR=1 FL=1|tara:strand:+ start:3622 stop:3858 length:237 start_codon:yes stop_codon:yes gene_type:complete
MKQLYRYELTEADLWWGKGICNHRAVDLLPKNYFYIKEGHKLADVENQTVTIEAVEHPTLEDEPEIWAAINMLSVDPI